VAGAGSKCGTLFDYFVKGSSRATDDKFDTAALASTSTHHVNGALLASRGILVPFRTKFVFSFHFDRSWNSSPVTLANHVCGSGESSRSLQGSARWSSLITADQSLGPFEFQEVRLKLQALLTFQLITKTPRVSRHARHVIELRMLSERFVCMSQRERAVHQFRLRTRTLESGKPKSPGDTARLTLGAVSGSRMRQPRKAI
jgi:hypothetical protein